MNFIVYIKIDDIYREVDEDVEPRHDTWNYELDRSLPKRKKAIGLMKDHLRGKISKNL